MSTTLSELIAKALTGEAPTAEQLGELKIVGVQGDRVNAAKARQRERERIGRYIAGLARNAASGGEAPEAYQAAGDELLGKLAPLTGEESSPAALAADVASIGRYTAGPSHRVGDVRRTRAETERLRQEAEASWVNSPDDPRELADLVRNRWKF